MGIDHIMVAGLTAVSIALLVWIEVRSRRNSRRQEQNRSKRERQQGSALDRPRKNDAA